ncbi:galactokinase [Nocardia panacis]|uniref:Galactokinase n=1 Tax=Nocardia panacis TaxID=2340916 RepID=A0A3A4JZB9_9NOCA|nr:galactokinase [Nocardia panacis]RJO72548.1 galactokinase [Nocardia panacis]
MSGIESDTARGQQRGPEPAAGVWAAPGRVNIIGEHTDYNGGYMLPIALPHTVSCVATKRSDAIVRVRSRQQEQGWIAAPLMDLADAEITGWARYPLGVVHEFQRRGHRVGGLDLALDGTVPAGAGLSSSAAVECCVAVALRDMFAPWIGDAELVDIAHTAENEYVGVPSGILDQSASLRCTAGHALFLDAATGDSAQVPFDLASTGLALLVIDTNAPHQLVGGEYAQRRAQCERAAAELGVPLLRDITDVADLDRLTDPLLHRRARHIVTENARVLEVVAALCAGRDPRTIGPTLSSAHASLRDDFEVSTAELDTAVEIACAAGAYGARMVGGGFGGSIIALVEATSTDHIAATVADGFQRRGYAPPRSFVATAAAGARRIG